MQLAAIAVVGQAVVQMARSLCPDTPRRMLAVLAASILILVPDMPGQIMVLLIGAFIGWFLPQEENVIRAPLAMTSPSYGTAVLCLVLFAGLLGLSVCSWAQPGLALAALFYRTGALVFGGGHVVLPLLQSAVVVPGYVAPGLFLAGYGAAQALPGPLFTFAAFLGAVTSIGPGGLHGGLIALAAIFLPGLLLVSGVLPYWNAIRQNRPLTGCINGVNAVVVGLLAYALLNLITLGGIGNPKDVVIAGIAFLVLILTRIPPFCAVIFCIAAAIIAQNGVSWR
jgi:chromate transporter